MINESVVQNMIGIGLSMGATFVEIFFEQKEMKSLSMVNGVLEKAVSGLDYGIGIRMIRGTQSVYSYTNDTKQENLIQIAKSTAVALEGTTKQTLPLNFMKNTIANAHVIAIPPQDGQRKQVVTLLRQASDASYQYSSQISETNGSYMDYTQAVLIANSEGLWVTDQRTRTRLSVEAIASDVMEKQTGAYRPGAHKGFEFVETLDMADLGRKSAEMALTMLKADFCPSGKMPVVIDNGFGGVIFHEACGHSLEATAISKGASVFTGKLGEQIASPIVTAVDDGTLKNEWGSQNIDDEGHPTQKNILIENGILKSYLVDRFNGQKMDMESTGSGRRESYKYAPTSRMTNTFIANGQSTPEEIIRNTPNGLYAKVMGGGSVQPATGSFNFSVREGYLIKNGKIAAPVRGATLIGKGAEVLMKIDMVGNNLAMDQGMCGSVSGSIPTNVGQPMIRIEEMTVGGRG